MKNYHVFARVLVRILAFFSKGMKAKIVKGRSGFILVLALFIISSQFFFVNGLDAQIAADKCKFFGNVISGSVPSNFTTYWNQVTPENSGKWGSVQGNNQATFSWNGLDLAYSTAKTNHFPFKHHNFVWGQQQPSWLNALSGSDIAIAVENWISSYAQRYPNTDMIDVVNEPLHAVPTYADALGGSGATGYDWIIWTFTKARYYCPNAKLILNDYNIINDDGNTNAFIGIINILKSRNLIDGIGEQGHFWETTPIATLTNNLNKLAALGLPIYISEYDVNLADDAQQLAKYQEQIPVLWNNSMVKGITLWGYIYGQIWRTSAYLVDANGYERPALTWLKQYIPTTNVGYCTPAATNDITANNSEDVIFPNPTVDGKFKIKLPSDAESVSIVDLGGRLIKSAKLKGESTIDMTIDNTGIYIVRITSSHGVTNKKLIVK